MDGDGRPAGGWIAAGLPHRLWIDPFLLWAVLPVEPRLVFFGDARTMARSRLRRWVVRRVGGILPIPSHGGPKAFATHLAAASDVLSGGAVFALFPEAGPPGARRDRAHGRGGFGYVGLRSRAPIVPIVIGGNDELFLRTPPGDPDPRARRPPPSWRASDRTSRCRSRAAGRSARPRIGPPRASKR